LTRKRQAAKLGGVRTSSYLFTIFCSFWSSFEGLEFCQAWEVILYGLEAINAANGWAMAIYGVLIVMIGLFVLSTVIAQFPKGVALLEKHRKKRMQSKAQLESEQMADKVKPEAPRHILSDIEEIANLYGPVVKLLGDSFELRDLYKASEESDLPHPHLSIRTLREAGILVPTEEGGYGWNR
jgi:hypothetical protein